MNKILLTWGLLVPSHNTFFAIKNWHYPTILQKMQAQQALILLQIQNLTNPDTVTEKIQNLNHDTVTNQVYEGGNATKTGGVSISPLQPFAGQPLPYKFYSERKVNL